MRILYHHRTQAEDGQAVHIRALQQAWREEGHEVREVSLVARQDAPAPVGFGSTGSKAAPAASRWGAVTRLPRFARELAEYAYTPVARPRLRRAIREFRPDFLYERYAFGNAAGVQAARRASVPIVLEVNSPMVIELARTRGLSFPALARRMEAHVFTSADLVCAVTGVLRDILVDLGVARERVLVTPNGVHLEAFAHVGEPEARRAAREDLGLTDADTGPVLGFVGYYRDWHRLDLVIRALPRLADARLVLVGEGPAHDELVRHAREAGVATRVHFAGRRPHARVPAVLPAFDVALVPAINAYASPLKLHEYMAAGLAVVAPDQPNLREVLTPGHDALLVPPGDGAALEAALAGLVADGELRRALGAAARDTIRDRDLTWRGNARRVIDAVKGLR